MKLRHIAGSAIAAAALVMGAMPASAHAGAFAVNGTANTSGTWAPLGLCVNGGPPPAGSLCPAANTWVINSGTTGTGSHNQTPETVSITGSGTFNGHCGSSTGSGSVTVSGVTNITFAITWTSAGGTIVLQGSGGGHNLTASIQARPTTGNCVTVAATTFLIAGTATVNLPN